MDLGNKDKGEVLAQRSMTCILSWNERLEIPIQQKGYCVKIWNVSKDEYRQIDLSIH